MGNLLKKISDGLSFEDSPEETCNVIVKEEEEKGLPDSGIRDPRSPATVGVDRTPLPSALADENQAAWDPRSPTSGIVRTPLHPPLFDTPPDSLETTPVAQPADPIIHKLTIECDVHRETSIDSVLDEGDSLYANHGSEECRSDYGSLENLLLSSSTSLLSADQFDTSEDNADSPGLTADPGVSPIGSPAMANKSARLETVAEESIVLSSTPLKVSSNPLASNDKVPPLTTRDANSPIVSRNKSPSRGLALRDSNSPVLAGDKSPSKKLSARDANSPIARVDQSSGRKLRVGGLTTRDTSSPLAVLRQKQVTKANHQLAVQDNNHSMVDKENLLQ